MKQTDKQAAGVEPFLFDENSGADLMEGADDKGDYAAFPDGNAGKGWSWRSAIPPWLREYKMKKNLSRDIVAGLTVGVMCVPQAMSYASIAGLSVEHGLYAAAFGFCFTAALPAARRHRPYGSHEHYCGQ